ncbi:hypothetical protein FACS1894105_06390 [Clostridia bacterium]|nr:hypothetical protein FACS1894105_06390 [Clostridia bacterium]
MVNWYNQEFANSRWVYTTGNDKKFYFRTIYVVSFAVLLELLLLILVNIFAGMNYYNFIAVLKNILPESTYNGLSPGEIDSIFSTFTEVIATVVSIGIPAFVLVLFTRGTEEKLNFDSVPKADRISYKWKMPKFAPLLLALGISFATLANYISLIFMELLGILSDTVYEDMLSPAPESWLANILTVFMVVILAPLAEEFFFRYLILNRLKRFGNTFAIIVSSIFFGFMHADLNAFFYATAVGLVLAYSAIKTKSVWFPVLLHMVINALSTAISIATELEYAGYFLEYISIDAISSAVYSLIFLVTVIFTLYLIFSRRDISLREENTLVSVGSGYRALHFINIFSVPFFVISIGMYIYYM